MSTRLSPAWARRARRRQTLTAVALAAVFATTGCTTTASSNVRTTDGSTSTSTTTSTTSTSTPTTSTTPLPPHCEDLGNGMRQCAIEGRPLRRRRRRRLLLPLDDDTMGPADDRQARTEWASVASFGELALRLIALGAPMHLVEACHRAALEEISHARTADALAGRARSRFGAIPGLLGRRIGGWATSRRRQLARIAVESYLDGWVNESAAADLLRSRAAGAATARERAALDAMAGEEDGHALLAKDIVLWCYEEDPKAVGRALGRVVSVTDLAA